MVVAMLVERVLRASEVQRESKKSGPTVLSVATEWYSAHGGLSTFNRELCEAMARSVPRTELVELGYLSSYPLFNGLR